MIETDVAIIGAGPIGIELAVAMQDAGVDYHQFDAGCVGQTITWYPKQVQFFSSPDRIAICGVPFQTPDQTKATREQYLAYLRSVVEQFDLPIRTQERVLEVQRIGDGFDLVTAAQGQEHRYRAGKVVVAMGDMHKPRMLNVPGEDLPHVSHYFDEPHRYFREDVLVVGGRNSAVEAAIRCHRAGARVTMSYRGEGFTSSVKYWLKPEIDWLIETGKITYHPQTVLDRVLPTAAVLRSVDDGGPLIDVPCNFVLLMTGYEMDHTLLGRAGVDLVGENHAPHVNPQTMETNVPGLYVAGTAAAGTQQRFKLFIENCHPHVIRISRAITGKDPKHINPLGWSRLEEGQQVIEGLLER